MTAAPQAGPALDRLIGETIFNLQGIGYYGPPVEGRWDHIRSRRFDTPEDAFAAVEQRWPGKHDSNPICGQCYWRDGWGPVSLPEYSSDPTDALAVVERLVERGFWVDLRSPVKGGERQWTVSIGRGGEHRMLRYAMEDTMPLAVCRVALAAVGARPS